MFRSAVTVVFLLVSARTAFGQATITGRLAERRGETPSPVAGCTVFARTVEGEGLVGEYSGDDGKFRLDFPNRARVTVGTQCPGYRVVEINGLSRRSLTLDCSRLGDCGEVNLTLEPLAAIDGFVTDPNGEPLEQVMLELAEIPSSGNRSRGARIEHSDSRGYFRFYHLSPGDYELAPRSSLPIHQGPSWQGEPIPVSVGAGALVTGLNVPMRLTEVVDLTGRIEGLPPGTTQVNLVIASRDSRVRHSFGTSVIVDSEGRFSYAGLPMAKYSIRATVLDQNGNSRPGATAYRGIVDLSTAPDERVLQPYEPARIRGRVMLESPERASPFLPPLGGGLHLLLQPVDGTDPVRVHASAPEFELESGDVPPGRYSIQFGARGAVVERPNPKGDWEPAGEIDVREGAAIELDLRIRFELGRLLVHVKPPPGSVEESQGLPAAHFAIGIRNDQGVRIYPADQYGKLVVSAVPGGDYEVCAWRDISVEMVNDAATWRDAGDAVRGFRHEPDADTEITLTAAP